MIVLLMWLTVSTPFVYASQQQQAKQGKLTDTRTLNTGCDEDTSNPFGNNTEEKNPGSNTQSEEYLHTFHLVSHFDIMILLYHTSENTDAYIAFHGELLVPPPNFI